MYKNRFSLFLLLVRDKTYQTNISKARKKKQPLHIHHRICIDRQPQKKNEESRRHNDDNDVDIYIIKRMCMCMYICSCA